MKESILRIENFAVSLDGFGAGLGQDLENPIGAGGLDLMDAFFHTRVWREMHGEEGGEVGVDNDMARTGLEGVGAYILGRNMFGPIRGPWPDENWRGWWGDEPPYHTPVFVLTHHARPSLKMEGGTEFHFVTDGIDSALKQARDAAGGLDVRLGGGVDTVRQYLRAGLVDRMHLVLRPVLLGSGEALFQGLDLRALGYHCNRSVTGERATHVFLAKQSGSDHSGEAIE